MKKLLLITLLAVILILSGILLIRTPMARKMNEKGLQYFSNTEYNQAEKYFAKALQWKGNYKEGIINLTKCQLELQKPDQAEETIEKLVLVLPNHAETLGLQGQLLVSRKKYKEAIKVLNKSIATDSLLAYAYFYRGISHANLGNLEAAAVDFLKAQELDKANEEALKKGALILSRLKNFEAAITNYDKLLELNPLNTQAYFQRGNFKMQIGDYPGAIDDFGQTIKLDNTLAEAYYNRGRSYATLEEFKEAIADFVRSAELNFKAAGAYYNSGLASLKINDLDKAKEYLLKCIALDKKKEHASKAFHLLGVLEMMRENSSTSIGYFNRSIKLDSTFADAYFNRGIAYGMMKEYRKAIRDLNTCIKLGNTSPDVYFARGVNKISLFNYAAGCDDLAKAEELGYEKASNMRKQYCKQFQK